MTFERTHVKTNLKPVPDVDSPERVRQRVEARREAERVDYEDAAKGDAEADFREREARRLRRDRFLAGLGAALVGGSILLAGFVSLPWLLLSAPVVALAVRHVRRQVMPGMGVWR